MRTALLAKPMNGIGAAERGETAVNLTPPIEKGGRPPVLKSTANFLFSKRIAACAHIKRF
jgi:hypothetical protein